MTLKICILCFLILVSANVQSQTLLNADSAHIKKEMLSRGGKFSRNRIECDFQMPGCYHNISYKFVGSILSPGDIVAMIFFVNNQNKCFKYLTTYTNDLYISKLKEIFNRPNSGLRQVKDSLKWKNIKDRYIIEILPRIPINNKISPIFVVSIENE